MARTRRTPAPGGFRRVTPSCSSTAAAARRRARLTSVGRNAIEVRVARVRDAPPDPLPPIHLLVAAVRAERLSWIAEKATELGATTPDARRQRAHTSRARARVARGASVARDRRGGQAVGAARAGRALEGPVPYARALRGRRPRTPVPARPARRTVSRRAGAGADVASRRAGGRVGGGRSSTRRSRRAGSTVSLSAGKLRAETAAVAALTLARAALSRRVALTRSPGRGILRVISPERRSACPTKTSRRSG